MPRMEKLKKQSAASRGSFFLIMFAFLHLLYIGWDAARGAQLALRAIYQNPLVEALIMGSLVVHMYSNTMIHLKRQALVSASKKKERDNVPTGLVAHRYTD